MSAGLLAFFIASAAAFIFAFASGPSLERDETGRARSCGVRTSLDGRKYCAAEIAAKNPQAMHRCPGHDGAVIVNYVEEDGQEGERTRT